MSYKELEISKISNDKLNIEPHKENLKELIEFKINELIHIEENDSYNKIFIELLELLLLPDISFENISSEIIHDFYSILYLNLHTKDPMILQVLCNIWKIITQLTNYEHLSTFISETKHVLTDLRILTDVDAINFIFDVIFLYDQKLSYKFDIYSIDDIKILFETIPQIRENLLLYSTHILNDNEYIFQMIDNMLESHIECCISCLSFLIQNDFESTSMYLQNHIEIFSFIPQYPESTLSMLWKLLDDPRSCDFVFQNADLIVNMSNTPNHSILATSILHKTFLLTKNSDIILNSFRNLNDLQFEARKYKFSCIMDIICTDTFDFESDLSLFFENLDQFLNIDDVFFIQKICSCVENLYQRSLLENKVEIFKSYLENIDIDEFLDTISSKPSLNDFTNVINNFLQNL